MATNTAAAPYRNTPTENENTATTASRFRAGSSTGSRVAATTATDWLATTQMNQVPFAAAITGRCARLSTAVQGMT